MEFAGVMTAITRGACSAREVSIFAIRPLGDRALQHYGVRKIRNLEFGGEPRRSRYFKLAVYTPERIAHSDVHVRPPAELKARMMLRFANSTLNAFCE